LAYRQAGLQDIACSRMVLVVEENLITFQNAD
jgi:hypothetical protein